MLEGLDQIDWGRLTHAYGPADGVPGWVRALASEDADTRKKAHYDLRWTIHHQGSRYRASAPAVPFLFEVLEAPGTADRAWLIDLLEELAVGYAEWYVPLGFDPALVFAVIAAIGGPAALDQIRSTEPDEDADDEPERLLVWQQDAYEAVEQRLSTLQTLTRDADVGVRRAAVKALAWFPRAAPQSILLVRAIIRGRPDPDELANAILCVGILGRSLGDLSDADALAAELAPDRPPPVRLAAALTLAVLLGRAAPVGVLAFLLEAIQDQPRMNAEMGAAGWHSLGPVVSATAALDLIKPPPTEATLAAVCQAAERVQDVMAGAEVFRVLLDLVIPDPSRLGKDPRTGFRRLDPAEVTADQRRALAAIGRSPVWDKQPYFYGHLMDIGLIYGLPWYPDRYRTLLDEVLRAAPGSTDAAGPSPGVRDGS